MTNLIFRAYSFDCESVLIQRQWGGIYPPGIKELFPGAFPSSGDFYFEPDSADEARFLEICLARGYKVGYQLYRSVKFNDVVDDEHYHLLINDGASLYKREVRSDPFGALPGKCPEVILPQLYRIVIDDRPKPSTTLVIGKITEGCSVNGFAESLLIVGRDLKERLQDFGIKGVSFVACLSHAHSYPEEVRRFNDQDHAELRNAKYFQVVCHQSARPSQVEGFRLINQGWKMNSPCPVCGAISWSWVGSESYCRDDFPDADIVKMSLAIKVKGELKSLRTGCHDRYASGRLLKFLYTIKPRGLERRYGTEPKMDTRGFVYRE